MANGEKATGALARVTTRRRVTIVKPALDAAGLEAGDAMTVRVLGPGRVELTRVDELTAEHSGRIDGGGEIRKAIEQLRDD